MCLAVKGYVEFTAERVKGIVAIVVEFGREQSEDWPVVTSINIAIYTHVSQLGMLEEWLEQLNANQSSQLLYQNLCNFVYPPPPPMLFVSWKIHWKGPVHAISCLCQGKQKISCTAMKRCHGFESCRKVNPSFTYDMNELSSQMLRLNMPSVCDKVVMKDNKQYVTYRQGLMQDKIIASHTCFCGHMDVNC